MGEHEMQFGDGGADWCIHCGTFGVYCKSTSCTDDRSGKFNCAIEENWGRMFRDTFGVPTREVPIA